MKKGGAKQSPRAARKVTKKRTTKTKSFIGIRNEFGEIKIPLSVDSDIEYETFGTDALCGQIDEVPKPKEVYLCSFLSTFITSQ